jgi:hypothetical protein
MLRSWLKAAFGKKGPRADICNRRAVRYKENGRQMTIAGEMLTDGFEIYVASILTWDDSHGELIAPSERERILRNVKASLESQGARVVLN